MSNSETEYLEEENDIFQGLDIIDDDENDLDDKDADSSDLCTSSTQQNNDIQYQHRKPKWWRKISGHRGSKAQRRALQSMESHKLAPVKYGSFHDFKSTFPMANTLDEIWLEIGCGQGDVLLANAERHPHVAFIGADVHQPGIGAALVRIKAGLQQNDEQQYWKDYSVYSASKDPFAEGKESEELDIKLLTTSPRGDADVYSNVRLFSGDGMKLLHTLSTSSLDVIMITFPDPWAKPDGKPFRVIQSHTLRDLHRVLRPDGRLFLATDHIVFYEWSKDIVAAEPSLFERMASCPHRSTWLPVISKYEQKGWDEGRQTFLACWEAKKSNDTDGR